MPSNTDVLLELYAGLDLNRSRKDLKADILTLRKFAKEYSLVLPAKINTADITKIKKQMTGLTKDLGLKNLNLMSFDTTPINDKLTKVKAIYKNNLGEAVKIQRTLNIETGQMVKTQNDVTQVLNKTKQSLKPTTAEFEEYQRTLALAKREAQALNTVIKGFGTDKHHKEADKLSKSIKQIGINSDMTKAQIEKQIGTQKNLSKEMSIVSREARAQGKASLTLGSQISNAIEAFGVWSAVTVAYYKAIQIMGDAIKRVKELDDAFLELRKVTNISDEALDDFKETAMELGEEVNATAAEIVNASAQFARMGFSARASADLAKDALILTRIGDGIDNVSEASTSLIAILKGFNLEATESKRVIDAINEVSNNYAINTDDLADGLRRVAAIMSQTGNTLEQTIGLLTAAQEGIQNIEKVSSGFRTISSRLRRVEESVEDVDGATVKLDEAMLKYTDGAVHIEDANGGIRSMYDILVDLSGVWDTLGDKQQEAISFMVAGTRQSEVLRQTMQNLETTIGATTDALESTGSATAEMEKYTNSLQGQLDELDATWDRIINNTIESKFVSWLLSVANATSKIVESIGGLETLFIMLRPGAGVPSKLYSGIKGLSDYFESEYDSIEERMKELEGLSVYSLGAIEEAEKQLNKEMAEHNELLLAREPYLLQSGGYRELNNLEKQAQAYEEIKETLKGYREEVERQANQEIDNAAQERGWEKRTERAKAMYEEELALVQARKDAERESREAFAEQEKNLQAQIELGEEAVESMSTLEGVYKNINNEEKISYHTLLDLIGKYPEYASQIAQINDSKEDGISIAETLFEIEKQTAIEGVRGQIALIEAEKEAKKSKKEYLDLLVLEAEIKKGVTDPQALSQLSAAYDSLFETENDQLSSLFRTIRILQEATLDSITETTEGIEEVDDGIEEVEESYKSLADQILRNNIKAVDNYAKAVVDQMKDEQDALAETQEQWEQSWEDRKEASDRYYEDKEYQLNLEIDALKEQENIQSNINDLQEKQIELTKLQQKLLNIRKEKNVRVLTANGWEWQADPEKIKETQENITNLQNDILQTRQEQEYQAELERLNKKKEMLNREKTMVDRAFEDAKTAQDRFYDDLDKKIENWMDVIEDTESLGFKDRLATVREFVADYNAEMAKLKDASGANLSAGEVSASSKSHGATGVKESASAGQSNAIKNKLEKMAENSSTWWNVGEDGKKVKAEENQKLAEEIAEATGNKPKYNSSSGKWDVLTYKNGGDIKGDGLIHAHNKEGVLTPDMNIAFKTLVSQLTGVQMKGVSNSVLKDKTPISSTGDSLTVQNLKIVANDGDTLDQLMQEAKLRARNGLL